ncbi:hypothetical protein ACIBEA_03885 [Streptomyces sp. NPDC051555]|uniref:hypothetical protein n=1 Tax=Streptomyces sp. NPDC051555 TaxID=3365657 RepID=UPI00379EF193
MKISKRIVATSAAVLLGTVAFGGAAHAADGHGGAPGKDSQHQRTVHAAPGTDHVPAQKIRPASKDNPYSQTIKAAPGTEHTAAGVLAQK